MCCDCAAEVEVLSPVQWPAEMTSHNAGRCEESAPAVRRYPSCGGCRVVRPRGRSGREVSRAECRSGKGRSEARCASRAEQQRRKVSVPKSVLADVLNPRLSQRREETGRWAADRIHLRTLPSSERRSSLQSILVEGEILVSARRHRDGGRCWDPDCFPV